MKTVQNKRIKASVLDAQIRRARVSKPERVVRRMILRTQTGIYHHLSNLRAQKGKILA